MVAPTLIAAAWNMPGTPERWKELPPDLGGAARRVPRRRSRRARRARARGGSRSSARARADRRGALHPRPRRGRDGVARARGHAGAARGDAPSRACPLIIEDVCVPPARVAEAAHDLQALLGKHGFLPGLAGHASAGNLHFLLTPNFGEQADLERYDAFMHELVELIVEQVRRLAEGRARHRREHGAVRRARVGTEGDRADVAGQAARRSRRDARARESCSTATPACTCATSSRRREIEDVATKCIECGFCEPVCPSRNADDHAAPADRAAPRDGAPAGGLAGARRAAEQYEYDGDRDLRGRRLVHARLPGRDRHRQADQGARGTPSTVERGGERAAPSVARRYAVAERVARGRSRVGGPALSGVARQRPAGRAGPPSVHRCGTERRPSTCRPASTGSSATARPRAPIRRCPRRWSPSRRAPGCRCGSRTTSRGHCCGTPWSSKGYEQGHELMAGAIREALARWSEEGRLPVVIDASSCTHGADRRGRARGGRGARLDRLGPRPPARSPSAPAQARERGRPSHLRLGASRSVGEARGDRRQDGRRGASSRPVPAAAEWPATGAGCIPSSPRRRLRTVADELGAARSTPASRATERAKSPCRRSPASPTPRSCSRWRS